MPYIPPKDRKRIDKWLDPNEGPIQDIGGPGELNYFISRLCHQHCVAPDNPSYPHRLLNYERINEVIGVLECVKQEFYRRVVVPYEDAKIRLNGDVY